MKISMLIPTLNNIALMKMAVRSYRNHTVNPHEILVYANAMSPEMKSYAMKEDFDVFQCSPRNEGISFAVNSLAVAAAGDVICYMNDDMYAAPGWDMPLVKKMNPDIFYQYLTICMFEPKGISPIMNAPFDYGLDPETWHEKDFLAEWWDKRLIKEDVRSGSAPTFITKELWDSIGGFDEALYPGLVTDPDINAKVYFAAERAGMPYEFRGVADSGMYHFQARTLHTAEESMPEKLGILSWDIFMKKWGMSPTKLEKLLRIGEKL